MGRTAFIFLLAVSLAMPLSLGCSKQKEKPEESRGSVNLMLDPIVVNLADHETRYLRVTIGLELADEKDKAVVEKEIQKVRDGLLMLLSCKYYEGMMRLDGKIRLKNEIAEMVDGVLKKKGVIKVYFTEFIAQ
ncbi:MAG: flagellar basal body-associated FliL family protein [Nitrospirota bacterium]